MILIFVNIITITINSINVYDNATCHDSYHYFASGSGLSELRASSSGSGGTTCLTLLV